MLADFMIQTTTKMTEALLTGNLCILEDACRSNKDRLKSIITENKLNKNQAERIEKLYNTVEEVYIQAFTDIYYLHKDLKQVLTNALTSIKLEE